MKKVDLNLVGVNGNAFSVIAAFTKQAKKEGWTAAEIKEVTDKALAGDYDHLIRTIMERCR